MRQVLKFLSLCTLAACPGPEPLDPTATSTGLATAATASAATTGPVTGDWSSTAATTTAATTTTTITTTGEPWTTTTEPGTTGPVDNGPCLGYKLVLDKPGPALWVTKDVSVHETSFLQPGEGFYCVRVEFDLQTLDNLADIAVTYPDGCPELLGLASVFGTQISGDVLATAFFHGMDLRGDTCTPGPARIEVGNYLSYVADTEGPWSPGQVWHIILESKPWLTRISIFSQGKQLGETIAADLFPADVEDTRDPVVRLGLPMPVEDRFYPWYGATYANLQVWADVAPPPPPPP